MTTGKFTEHSQHSEDLAYIKTTSYDSLSDVLRQVAPIWIHHHHHHHHKRRDYCGV